MNAQFINIFNLLYMKNKFVIVCVSVFAYVFGGLTVQKQLFPFEQVLALKHVILGKNGLQPNSNWPERRDQFKLFVRQADVVMIGDSITHAGHWDDIFQSIKIANRGIGSDRTDDVLRRIGQITNVNPKKAFIMIGINDFNWERSVDDVFFDYIKIVNGLTEKGIKVYIQATLECSKWVCGNKLLSVRELNAKLKDYCIQDGLQYIDINKGLVSVEEGLLDSYTYDGIHLLGAGYEIWSKSIAPYVLSP